MVDEKRTCPYCGSEHWDWLPYNDGWDYAATCENCERVFGSECEECDDGFVYEDDLLGDWINYGHNLIACPRCRGEGVVWTSKAAAEAQLKDDE